jgi:hypothetical protein
MAQQQETMFARDSLLEHLDRWIGKLDLTPAMQAYEVIMMRAVQYSLVANAVSLGVRGE